MAARKSTSRTKVATRTSFNLATRSVAETCVVPILDPEDGVTPTGIVITLAARHSKHATAAALAIGKAQREAGAGEAEPADWRVAVIPLVAACTLSWVEVEDGDERPACTAANAEKLYRKYPWLNEQVVTAFLGKTAFFDATRTA